MFTGTLPGRGCWSVPSGSRRRRTILPRAPQQWSRSPCPASGLFLPGAHATRRGWSATPGSHVPHLRTNGRFVEVEQGGERRTLPLVHVVDDSNELAETLTRLAGPGDGRGDDDHRCSPDVFRQGIAMLYNSIDY